MVMDRDILLRIIGQLTVEKAMLQDAISQLVAEREALQKQVKDLIETKHPIGPQQVGQENADAGGA